MGTHVASLSFLPGLALCLASSACSGNGPAGPEDASPHEDASPQYDLPPRRDAGPDVLVRPDGYPGHPEEDWAWDLDVPWDDGGTRQLVPIEVPPVVAASDCGTACRQVTFLPGYRRCTTFGPPFSVDGNYLTTDVFFDPWHSWDQTWHRCMQVYVDLTTLRAFVFGSIMPGPVDSACGSADLKGGRIAYGCNASRWTSQPVTDRRAEVRVFDIATSSEQLLWQAANPGQMDQPLSISFAGDSVAYIMRPGCPGCTTLFLQPATGGERVQLYPAASQDLGGIDVVAADYPYVAVADFQRFYGALLGVEVVAIDLRQPDVFIDLSEHAGDQWMPRVSGSRVVWVDTRNAPGCDSYSHCNYDIYVKDLVSGEERAVCTDPAAQDNADIEGDVVVWLDCREEDDLHKYSVPCFSPYLMSLTDGVEHRVEAPDWYGYGLRLNGGRLYFVGTPADDQLEQVYEIDLRQLGLVP
jgi:hypothetical protein